MSAPLFLIALLAAFGAVLPAHGQWPVVAGEPVRAAVASAEPRLRLGPAKAAQAKRVLPDIADQALAEVRAANARRQERKPIREQRMVIGVVRGAEARPAEDEPLAWTPVPGGFAAQLSISSPRAESMRLALELAGLALDVEMVFFGSANPSRIEGPVRVGDIRDRSEPWWSPVTEGDTQTVEFFVPLGHDPARMPIAVSRASHLVAGPSTGFAKRMQEIGASGSCNVDLACSGLASQAAFRDAAAAVAQMVFTDAGYTSLCTGTLLNDSDSASQIPYFFSANHCFENASAPYKTPAQMQTVANSLTTLWGFEASACASRTPRSDWTQRSGGATFLYNDVTADAMLLRLNDTPPAGAYFSGWDPNPVAPGSGVIAIHHPEGDLKKVSEGLAQRFSTSPGVAGGSASFIEVQWSRGTTERGSSGSGLWTASGSQYVFRGSLWGGTAFCTNPSGTDFYSRLDLVYPAIASHLGSSGGGGVDYTDLWWNPNESGWGLNLIQHPSRVIFGVWYTYAPDGKRTWFVMPSGTWTTSSTYTGPLYATAGPHLAQPFDAAKVHVSPVGSATLSFSDANRGTFSFTIDGVAGSKSITRQPF